MPYYCGLFYHASQASSSQGDEKHLPRLNQLVYTTILSTSSRTILSQSFVNDSKDTIDQCRYEFPLYDGVSVVGFACQIGNRTIEGLVKEKTEAKEVYDDAVAEGKTAGLLAQGPTSDVFSTTLGNIPAGETIVIKVTYIGELKHDVGAQCTKFTIPTSIAPRYGRTDAQAYSDDFSFNTDVANSDEDGLEITIDISMGSGSIIREVRSPSHPIAIKLGSTSTAPSTQTPQMSQASATLSQGSADLDKDFILEIVNDTAKQPKAFLETYTDDPRQKALMVTLVPAISLAPTKPEIIIIADRSGSMDGNKIATLVRALKIFLRSLPVGIYFNICSFGSRHRFLWDRSLAYGEESLAAAIEHVETFDASFGGTKTLAAIKASIEARDVKQDLALILCTDGQIWNQHELFSYLNTQVRESPRPIRVFPLGIGNAVSSGLIEGVARAGNGFASTVGEHEKLDGKVVRMLKGALVENITDYTFDIEYRQNDQDEDEDGFIIVESITESLNVTSLDDSETQPSASEDSPTSTSNNENNGHSRYAGLPLVAVPKYLQAPQEIPPLYPSFRTTIYIMISPDAPQRQPTSVILKGTSLRGPISYEIPVDRITEPGQTIHQLAARKAVGELEEGRGWLVHAKDSKGNLLKDEFGLSQTSSQFDKMVEREAVRLGIKYQVGGKFCSFVAVEENKTTVQSGGTPAQIEQATRQHGHHSKVAAPSTAFSKEGLSGYRQRISVQSGGSRGGSSERKQLASQAPRMQQKSAGSASRGRVSRRRFCAFGTPVLSDVAPSGSTGPTTRGGPPPSQGFFQSADSDEDKVASYINVGPPVSTATASRESNTTARHPLDIITSLQRFQGFWELEQALLDVCGIAKGESAGTLPADALRQRIVATILAFTYLERRMADEEETWELIVDKAKGWLDGLGIKVEEEVEKEPLKGLLAGI